MFRFIKSMFTGLVAGTLLGILFAPKKGKQVRESFKKDIKSGGYGLNALKETASEVHGDIKESFESIAKDERVKKNLEKAKEYGEKAKSKAGAMYKEHVPLEKRKNIKKTVKKAKTAIKKNMQRAAEKIEEASKKSKK